MATAYFITAIGTPLTEDEKLHEEGLKAHLADQWKQRPQGCHCENTKVWPL